MLKHFLKRGVVLSSFHHCFLISKVLQKLLRYFSGTIISTSTLPAILPSLLLAAVWPVILVLKLNESVALAPSKSVISPSLSTAGTSLQYCYKFPDAFE